MEYLIDAAKFTGNLLMRIGPVMFVSLFGTELIIRLGAMTYLKPLGRPMARLSNLSSHSAVTFLTGIGSMIAAHTMTAGFHRDGKISDGETVLSGVLNTVPFHFKEVLTFHFPVILPLLGFKLCMIYIAAFWTAGLVKLLFVIFWGRLRMKRPEGDEDAFEALEYHPWENGYTVESLTLLIKDSFAARKGMFTRMIALLTGVTFVVQVLVNLGVMKALDRLIEPVTTALGLPPSVIPPVSVYIFSPTVGITYMANLVSDHTVTDYQAIMALLAGGLIMIPVTRLRRTLPRYTAIFGIRLGPIICLVTAGLSMVARLLVLLMVPLFY